MKLWTLAFTTTVLVFSSSANSALIERLGGLAYYDTEADLTWLADANYAYTSDYEGTVGGGRMTWNQATIWANELNVAGVEGWRLPDSDTCFGFNCTSSEIGNLFYNVLGGIEGVTIYTTHNDNYNLFLNVVSSGYWSATEYSHNTEYALGFNMYDGRQVTAIKVNVGNAWAVHDGDVAALSSVPVPAAVWLFGSGLIGLAGIARRKKA